ncbi:hypothetical protein [Streptomyces sp. NPDC048338]|uniref:hypothetical protein n=1 Tax=Streptomyces sp. NPDC048338 TaxID=3365536 RepID=UPI003721A430
MLAGIELHVGGPEREPVSSRAAAPAAPYPADTRRLPRLCAREHRGRVSRPVSSALAIRTAVISPGILPSSIPTCVIAAVQPLHVKKLNLVVAISTWDSFEWVRGAAEG